MAERTGRNTPESHTEPGALPPAPASPIAPGELPHALTVFLSARERRLVLRALRHHHVDRSAGLLAALGIERDR